MKVYDTYIFDLYGTLIDIHTDESIDELWEELAAEYGKKCVVYTPAAIHEKYLEMVGQEEQDLAKATGFKYPEIRLDKVFARLYNEGKKGAPVGTQAEISMDDPWIQQVALQFRETSRTRLDVYENTVSTLKKLKELGKKVYLLSNAQRCFTEPEMRQVGIWNLFDDIFISSDHEKKKPQPEFMEELLKKHHIDRDRAVMIGNDFTSDIRIALECDMESIFLNTDRHSEAEMKSLLAKQKAQKPSEKEVYIISSGDIKEIL